MNLLEHLIHHLMQFLLLIINFDFRTLKQHVPTLYLRELGPAHWAFQLRLRPLVDALEAEFMGAAINLGHVIVAEADAALEY